MIITSREIPHSTSPHLLSQKLFCPYCQRPLKRRRNADNSAKWVCRIRNNSAKNCRLPILAEEYIQKTILGLLQQLFDNYTAVLLPLLEDYKEIAGRTSNQKELSEIYANITQLNEQAIVYAELKLQDIIPEEMYQQEVASMQYQIKQLRDRKNKVAVDSVAHDKAESLELLISFITGDSFTIKEITEDMLRHIDKIVVNMDETITIHFKGTLSITGGAEK